MTGAPLVQLLAALGVFWTIRGEHVRVLVLADAVVDALGDWQPPPELRGRDPRGGRGHVDQHPDDRRREQLAPLLRDLLPRLGPGDGSNPYVAGLVRVMLASDPADPEAVAASRLEQLTADGDR